MYLFYVDLVEFEICTGDNSDINKLYLFYCKPTLHHISFDWYNVQIIETKAKSIGKYCTYVYYMTSSHKANTNLIKGNCYSYIFDVF